MNNNDLYSNNKSTKDEMLQEIRSLDFAVTDLAEYLDTHPCDEKALCLHNEYATKLREIKDKYQRTFNPLTYKYPCNKWNWINQPWPWERGNN